MTFVRRSANNFHYFLIKLKTVKWDTPRLYVNSALFSIVRLNLKKKCLYEKSGIVLWKLDVRWIVDFSDGFAVVEIGGNHLNFLKNPLKSTKFLENPRKSPNVLKNPLKSFQLLINPQESSSVLQNSPKSLEFLKNPRMFLKILWNPSKSSKIFKRPYKSSKIL